MKFIKEGFILVLLFTLVILSTVYEGLPDLLPENTLLFVAIIAALIAVFNGILALREYNKFEGRDLVRLRIRLKIGMVYGLVSVFLLVMNYTR